MKEREADMEPIIIEFKGKKSFDNIKEAKQFKEELGDRYLRTWKSVHPDMTFYIVEYKED
jgi:uncharacterized protein YhfF